MHVDLNLENTFPFQSTALLISSWSFPPPPLLNSFACLYVSYAYRGLIGPPISPLLNELLSSKPAFYPSIKGLSICS